MGSHQAAEAADGMSAYCNWNDERVETDDNGKFRKPVIGWKDMGPDGTCGAKAPGAPHSKYLANGNSEANCNGDTCGAYWTNGPQCRWDSNAGVCEPTNEVNCVNLDQSTCARHFVEQYAAGSQTCKWNSNGISPGWSYLVRQNEHGYDGEVKINPTGVLFNRLMTEPAGSSIAVKSLFEAEIGKPGIAEVDAAMGAAKFAVTQVLGLPYAAVNDAVAASWYTVDRLFTETGGNQTRGGGPTSWD